jgi:hypothetical protein
MPSGYTDAIFAHQAHAMGQNKPTCLGFDRRTTVTYFHEFPRLHRSQQKLGITPETQIIREHQVKVLVVIAGKHRVTPMDPAREKRHPFVPYRGSTQSADAKVKKVDCFNELGEVRAR